MTQPGWYPDEQRPDLVRWWDGNQWTEHSQPRQSAASSSAPRFD
ncbi:MAG: DUF2510 domain-containing protein, partial [Ilumatobacter sp.]